MQKKRILRWAGIGPRKTPANVLEQMVRISQMMSASGWILSSGWGAGADQAFASGTAVDQQTAWLPWNGFNGAYGSTKPFKVIPENRVLYDIAGKSHPGWAMLQRNEEYAVLALMTRNAAILFGGDMDETVDLVIYWQDPNVAITAKGGTNHCVRVASAYGIPAFNIALVEDQHALVAYVNQLEVEAWGS